MAPWLTIFLIRFVLNTIILGGVLYLVAAMIEGRDYSKIKVAFTVSLIASVVGGVSDFFVPFLPIIFFLFQMFVWSFLIKHYFEEWLVILPILVVFVGIVYLVLGVVLSNISMVIS